jgi:hypothetical protein
MILFDRFQRSLSSGLVIAANIINCSTTLGSARKQCPQIVVRPLALPLPLQAVARREKPIANQPIERA